MVPGVETGVDCSGHVGACGLQVKASGRLKRRWHPAFPELAGLARFGVHNNSLNNGIRALVERVFRSPDAEGNLVPPPPCTADVGTRLGGFARRVAIGCGLNRRVSYETFVSYYHGRRQQLYARATESLQARPLTSRDFQVRNAFVKAEKINFTAKPDPAPRVIQPRDPRYNVEVGRYLRPLEHRMYKAIARVFGGPTVMKGYNAEDVAKEMRKMWDDFGDPVAIGLDASRFDQHVRPEMLSWEHSVYTRCFVGPEREYLRWLLRGQIRNKCSMRCDNGKVKYVVDGSRMSGDMNTALGNCLIMCALVHCLAEERGVRVRLANNGDDCVVFLERRDLARLMDRLPEWFLEFGFKMKVEEPVDVFERIEFCQAHPVWDGAHWIMVRNPHVTLSKDATCVNRDYAAGKAAQKWLHAVGVCGLALTGGIPVCQEHYAAFLRHGREGLGDNAVVTETGMHYLSRGLTRGYAEPSDDARVSFWRAFGIEPTLQRQLEVKLRHIAFDIPSSPCIASPSSATGSLVLNNF